MDSTLIPQRWAPVTPSNTAPVGNTIGLYVGTAGNVVAEGVDGVEATFVCQAGQYLTGKFTKVKTATTASNIVALLG